MFCRTGRTVRQIPRSPLRQCLYCRRFPRIPPARHSHFVHLSGSRSPQHGFPCRVTQVGLPRGPFGTPRPRRPYVSGGQALACSRLLAPVSVGEHVYDRSCDRSRFSTRPWCRGRVCLRHWRLMLPTHPAPQASAKAAERPVPDKIDFNRDVRPILSDNCYACHGPDKNKRKADLRLDTKDGLRLATTTWRRSSRASRTRANCSAGSRRTTPTSGCPPQEQQAADAAQIAVLKKWIEQGAEYKGHWAFIKPVRPEVPAVDEPGFRPQPDRPLHPGPAEGREPRARRPRPTA